MGHGHAHAATDVQAENQTQLDGKSCVDHAHDRAKEYAAALRFIGLLAGIGDDADVQEARRIVKEALREVGVAVSAPEALRNLEQAGRDQRNAEMKMGEALAPWDWSGERDKAWEAAGFPKGHDYNRWLETGPGVPANVMEAARNRRLAAENFDQSRQAFDEHGRQVIKDLFSSLWDGFRSAYNAAVASIENGTWKTALCKAGVNAGFLVAETAVGAALAAVLTPAVAAALKIVGKVVEKGSHLVRIGVAATRTKIGKATAAAHADKTFKRPINTATELKEAEKRVLGPENQGTTTATPGAGKSEPKAAAVTPSNKWKPKDVKGRRVYQRDDLIDPNRVDPDSGLTNLELMRNGRAPIGADGYPIELHHMVQQEGLPFNNAMAPLAEVSKTFHSKNYNQIHIYPRGDPDYISWRKNNPANARRYDRYREAYWAQRAGDFAPN
jgi:A nuclease of the HNH/ENDO VII superfamily with conserved LHH